MRTQPNPYIKYKRIGIILLLVPIFPLDLFFSLVRLKKWDRINVPTSAHRQTTKKVSLTFEEKLYLGNWSETILVLVVSRNFFL